MENPKRRSVWKKQQQVKQQQVKHQQQENNLTQDATREEQV